MMASNVPEHSSSSDHNQSQPPTDATAGHAEEARQEAEMVVLEARSAEADPEQAKLLQAASEHWHQVANQAPVEAITHIEESAKQLISLTSLLQGVYFAVFAFSNLRDQVAALALSGTGYLILLVYFAPVVLWLFSLYCATQVFVPKVRPGAHLNDVSSGGWQSIKQTYEETAMKKLSWLHRSHFWLIASFVVVLIVLVMLVFLPVPPTPKQTPIPIIIVTPTP